MEKFIILADSACDLCEEVRNYFGINDYITGHVHLPNGEDYSTYLDWRIMPSKEFYDLISKAKSGVSTSPANAEEFAAKFEKYVKEGYSVLSMSLSSAASSTLSNASIARERILEKYPDANIYCFDSYRLSIGFGLQVIYAYDMQNKGKSMAEIIEWLECNKYKVHQMGPIDDLFFAARHGRISMGKAIFGSFAGVKPMGDYSSSGYTSVLTKVKGLNKALKVTVEYLKKSIVNPEEQYLLVAHSQRPEQAKALKEMIENEVKVKKVFITEIFSACAPNIGAGLISVNFLGEKISDDLKLESSIMSSIVDK